MLAADLKKFKVRASDADTKRVAVELNAIILRDILQQLMAYDTNDIVLANNQDTKPQADDSIASSHSIINKDLAGASTREKSYNKASNLRSGDRGHRYKSSGLQESEENEREAAKHKTAEAKGRKVVGKKSHLSAQGKSPLRY